jgi:hypothetical protein
MEKHGGHEDLRGPDHRSIIPYVHGESVVLQCVWCCSSWELNFIAPVIHPDFYSSSTGSYTVTQGPTSGPRVNEIIYSI